MASLFDSMINESKDRFQKVAKADTCLLFRSQTSTSQAFRSGNETRVFFEGRRPRHQTAHRMSISTVLESVDRVITSASPMAVSILGTTCVYYVAFSYGVGVVTLVFGKDITTRLMVQTPTNPLLVLVGIPLIPVSLIALEAANIEGRSLMYWRRNISPVLPNLPIIGRVIEHLWPTPIREPLHSAQLNMGGAVDFMARNISSGLVLPFFAYFVGRVCFKFVESNPKKVVMGGLLFFSLKTLIKMYLRQQEYRRQGFRKILDYEREEETDSLAQQ